MIQIMEDCRSCFAAGQFADAGSVTGDIKIWQNRSEL